MGTEVCRGSRIREAEMEVWLLIRILGKFLGVEGSRIMGSRMEDRWVGRKDLGREIGGSLAMGKETGEVLMEGCLLHQEIEIMGKVLVKGVDNHLEEEGVRSWTEQGDGVIIIITCLKAMFAILGCRVVSLGKEISMGVRHKLEEGILGETAEPVR